MVETWTAISKMEFGDELAKILGFEPRGVKRIIIDIDASDPGPVLVYVEVYASDKILYLDWPEALRSAKVEILGKDDEPTKRSPDTPG